MAGTTKPGEDGTNPEGHIWRIAPSAPGFSRWLPRLGERPQLHRRGGRWPSCDSCIPVLLFEAAVAVQDRPAHRVGTPPNSTSEKWIKGSAPLGHSLRRSLHRGQRDLHPPRLHPSVPWRPRTNTNAPATARAIAAFASGWRVNATNFEGPAPRPMERFKLAVADDGQIVVDKIGLSSASTKATPTNQAPTYRSRDVPLSNMGEAREPPQYPSGCARKQNRLSFGMSRK